MAQHMLSQPEIGWVDKRKSPLGGSKGDQDSRHVGDVLFTANAAGTTTTIVGANATVGGANTIRVGEKVKLFNSSGALKEEKVFKVTAVAAAASTTVTFSPAAAVATASGDMLKAVTDADFQDNDTLDSALKTFNGTLYSQANLDKMTQNDKVYALRLIKDPGSL